MRVLGIDPGYAIVGWGVVDYVGNRFAPVDFGAVCTDAGVPFERRLDEVYCGGGVGVVVIVGVGPFVIGDSTGEPVIGANIREKGNPRSSRQSPGTARRSKSRCRR